MGYYDYQELRVAAIAPNANQDDINALGEWFSTYGTDSWNGEFYDCDDGIRLFPIYHEVDDDFELIGYEIR